MKRTLRISAVQYLNTRPYIRGLSQGAWALELDTPADCARKLSEGQVDLGLVPVAALPYLPNYRPVTNWGIGADGAVQSVVLMSQVPLEELKAVYLDYQSKTSNALLRILLKEFYHLDLVVLEAKPGYEDQIKNNIGGLVIGDRALRLKEHYAYCYDLAKTWRDLTELPFVFARWVAADGVSLEDEQALDRAFTFGMSKRSEIANEVKAEYPNIDIDQYLHHDIKYQLGPIFWQGLSLFEDKQRNMITSYTETKR